MEEPTRSRRAGPRGFLHLRVQPDWPFGAVQGFRLLKTRLGASDPQSSARGGHHQDIVWVLDHHRDRAAGGSPPRLVGCRPGARP